MDELARFHGLSHGLRSMDSGSMDSCLPFHGQFPGSMDSPSPRVPYRLFLLLGTYGLAVGLYLYQAALNDQAQISPVARAKLVSP
jgi:hypothetical protein